MSDKEYRKIGAATEEAVARRGLERAKRRELDAAGYRRDKSTGNLVQSVAPMDATSRATKGFECEAKNTIITPDGAVAMVPCDHCRPCVARRRNDATARIVMETAHTLENDGAAFMVTLTYDDAKCPEGAKEYDYHHVQQAMKFLRNRFSRGDQATTLRFYCVGERGEKYGRVHWHLILWFERLSVDDAGEPAFKPGAKKANGATCMEDRDFWPYGLAQVQRIGAGSEDWVRSARYVASYIAKGCFEGEDPETANYPARASQGRRLREDGSRGGWPIGAAGVADFYANVARSGLACPKGMPVDGMVNSRTGKKQYYAPDGSLGEIAAEAYMVAWRETHGDKPVASSPLLRRFWDDYVRNASELARYGMHPNKMKWHNVDEANIAKPLPKRDKRDRTGYFPVLRGQVCIGIVEMAKNGKATLHVDRPEFVAPAYRDFSEVWVRNGSLRGYVDLGEGEHDRLEAWIAERRGPNWLSDEDYKALLAERAARRRQGIIDMSHPTSLIGYNVRQCEPLKEDHNRDGPSQYDRPYFTRRC